jgi:Arc/MetJ family transcription regulator
VYGTLIRMKKTLNIDAQLLESAQAACGATTETETVRRGLEALVRHAAYETLRTLRGSEKRAQQVPRRREASKRKRAAA